MKGKNMKTTSKTLIAAIAGIAMFVGAAHAQYQATGADGITASPKVREMINSRAATSAQPAAPAIAKHSCPTCKDDYATRVDATARGAFKPTVLVGKHLCPGCETTIATTGTGKASRDVATHKCGSGGAETATCCTAKKT
jgi:hypothetical protein